MLAVASGLLSLPAPAFSQQVKPIADARLRYEHVGQDGFTEDASAPTFRLRAGAEVTGSHWAILGEFESVTALDDQYDSGLNGRVGYPLVADPDNFELNRLQLRYTGLRKTSATIGRQRINLDDQRFVGSSGWRQNEQTFDAIRVEHGDAKGFKADLTYSWSVRTIWGADGVGARQQAIGGNNVFATIGHPTPLGALSVYAYLVDQDEAAVQGFRLSSQSYGVRLAQTRAIAKGATLNYILSFARQSDYRHNPNDYRATYLLAEAGVEAGRLKLGLGHERLGADDGRALTSFQTPLATLHKFQGWADKFLTTPPNGIRDWYGSVGTSFKGALGLDWLNATAIRHRFGSDRLGLHYGNEWDAQLSAKKGRWTATAKFASYDADRFAADTRKCWLQVEWAY